MHFTVLVIGDDYDKILAPFNEQPDEDDTDCLDHCYWSCDAANGEEYTADTKVELEQEVLAAGTTIQNGPWLSNSQGYWDWYVLGGRWSGTLKLKNNATGIKGEPDSNMSTTDSALIKDIDFDGMYDEATTKAAITYDKIMTIFGELPIHLSQKEIQEKCRDKHGTIDYSKANIMYQEQPRLIALNTVSEAESTFPFFIDADDFFISREEYIELAKFQRISTHSIIDAEGVWYSRDDSSYEEYQKLFKDIIASLSPDTRISIIDCHV